MKKTNAKKSEKNSGINDPHVNKAAKMDPANPPPNNTAANDDVDESVTSPVTSQVESTEQLLQRIHNLEDSLVRCQADSKNLQRRSAVELAQALRYGNAILLKSLLTVIDDFERCITASAETTDTGVRLVYENFISAMQAQGLQSIEALHQPFDPTVHEAILQQPSATHPPGTVIEQVAKGYRLYDRILRPAQVIVSKVAEPIEAD